MSVSLREVAWPRFLRAPDGQLVARLYEPGLRRAVRYDRCCAYFSSSVLAAAASGFGAFIQRIVDGAIIKKPALRLRLRRHETIHPRLAVHADGEDLAILLRLLFERIEVQGPHTLRLTRHGLPGAVELDTATLDWRCSTGIVEGRGLVELGAWARDRGILSTACVLGAAQWGFAQVRRR